MKWELKEPKFGDMVRVKTGSIYHYGIYVSDEEVIQFGLNPIARIGVLDKDIVVCSSDINDFIVGGFLEVCALEKKDKKRFSPKKSVDIARSRLGEKGYHIIYNNCEHFSNECYFGEKYSSQTDGVRELFRNMNIVDVYVAKIPSNIKIKKLYPKQREREIKEVSNVLLKTQKYCVWKVLEFAINKSFSKNIKDLSFKLNDSGKWVSEGLEFSLSHSKNLVSVAVSKTPIGVDVELIEKPKTDISKEILSSIEYEEYLLLNEQEKTSYIINAWTKKESLFKQKNIKALKREEFRQLNEPVYQKILTVDGEEYSLSVATKNIDKVRVFENIELK